MKQLVVDYDYSRVLNSLERLKTTLIFDSKGAINSLLMENRFVYLHPE